MRSRLRHEPIAGRAHLKTGTLRDASCIAGYVLDKNGQRWALVVMVNAIPGQRLAAWHGHAVHHALLRWVHQQPPALTSAGTGSRSASNRQITDR
jgi:D-alanyl-D-alanine carboxypeptidase/D-alanyl-D-alanine-endopeptidase (penicillin-binding protein 4)